MEGSVRRGWEAVKMEMELAEYGWIRTSTHEADTGFHCVQIRLF